MKQLKWRSEKIQWEGKQRSFQWAGPSESANHASDGHPLAFAFHGSSSSADSMHGLGLESWVTDHGAWLVLPNGIGGGWNDERPRRAESTGFADDRGFVLALKEWMLERFPISKEWTFGAGFSNGAMLCQSLAARVPEHFCGFASVCGAVPMAIVESTDLVQPVSQYIFLGEKDTVIGNEFSDRYQWGEIKTAQQTLDWWKASWTESGLSVKESELRELETIQGGSSLKENIIRFNTGQELCLAKWKPGGHFWPTEYDGKWMGSGGAEHNLADRIWVFFQNQMG